MTEKRDESRDVAVWDSTDCESHIMRACQWEPGMDERAHHVPITELASVTHERDAAVRRAVELETMLVSHAGETWDSDKPPIRDRVFDLFDALNGIGTQNGTESVRCTLRTLLCNRESLARRVSKLETAARAYHEQASALERNVYNEYHANESLSVHEIGQLCLRCSQTGSILEALITTDPAKDPTQ